MSSEGLIPAGSAVEKFIDQFYSIHLCLPLSTYSDFNSWWLAVDKDIRTQYRKAQRAGYTFEWVLSPDSNDIGALWRSWEGCQKQDRPMNPTVSGIDHNLGGPYDLTQGWPFDYYKKTRGYLDFGEVFSSDGQAVAYIEIATAKNRSMVFHTMSHKEHMPHGIVKLMFVEVVRTLFERGVESLSYGKPAFNAKRPQSAPLFNDLRFREIECQTM